MADERTTQALRDALDGLRRARARIDALERGAAAGPMALCAVGLRLPGGVVDLDGVEAAMAAGRVAFGPVPAERWDASRHPGAGFGAFVDGVWDFDPAAFGLSPREAASIDPGQRLILLTVREALDTSGITLPAATGVYVATGLSDHAQRTLRHLDRGRIDAFTATGVLDSVAAGRVAYTLGLDGPALAVDTACSGGLVAVHLAMRDLRAGIVRAAVVASANVMLAPDASVAFAAMGALSPGGRCRPFHADADGYVRSEAAVAFVLARPEVAAAAGWPVVGMIHGSAVGQDGRSNGLTAPRGPAQATVVRAAWADAGDAPGSAAAIVAHGTGTPLGDPIEVAALADALGDGGPVPVVAPKARWGHAEPASGLVGVCEALGVLRRGGTPVQPGLDAVSPAVAAAGGRLAWPVAAHPVAADGRVGVSAFGFAGTNAHVVVGGPPPDAARPAGARTVWSLRTLSLPDPRDAVLPDGAAFSLGWADDDPAPGPSTAVVDLRDARDVDGLPARLVAASGVVVVGADPAAAACAAIVRAAMAEGRPLGLVVAGDAPPAEVARAVAGGMGAERAWRGGRWQAPVRRPAVVGPAVPVSGTWWVLGGTGVVGGWLVARLRALGAARVVVSSRTVAAGPDAVPVDLSDPDAILAAAEAIGPVDGVIVAAGGARDARLADVDPGDVAASRAVRGAAVAAVAAACPAARIRVVGTASTVLGVPGQAAYAAGAAWGEVVVARLRGAGRDAAVVRFGPVAGGLADTASAALGARGVRTLPAAALDALLSADPPDGVLDLDATTWVAQVPSPRAARWLGVVASAAGPLDPETARRVAHDAVAATLGVDTVPAHVGLFDLGLDSLSAVALARELSTRAGRPVPPTIAFERPDVASLAGWLAGEGGRPSVSPGATRGERLVITGFAGRFPGGAHTAAALYDLVASGADALCDAPADRYDAAALAAEAGPGAVRGGFLTGDVFAFDPVAHGLSPREARAIDPAQRLLLTLAVEALDDAGWSLDALRGAPVGVFVGIDDSEHGRRLDMADPTDDRLAGTGNAPAFAAGRLAHRLGTRGPAVVVDTACSSALVALAAAVDAVRAGRCEAAIVGAVHLVLGASGTRRLAAMGALSPSGRCLPFDTHADGFMRGEGGAVWLVERETDAVAAGRPVRAVIRGVAVGHDGPAAGLTAPDARAQEAVQRAALAEAGVAPAAVGWVEAHGTGTPLGDPVELRAIAAVHAGRPSPVPVTASKRAVGHLEAAAGAASLAVVLEGLARGRIPASAVASPVDAGGPDVVFPNAPCAWGEGPRLAAISAFGMSGTNAHVVLEGPASPPRGRPVRPWAMRHLEVPWVPEVAERALGAIVAGTAAPGPVAWIVPGDGTGAGGLALVRRLPPAAAVRDRVAAAVEPGRRAALRRALAGVAGDADADALARFVVAVGVGRSLGALGATPAWIGGHGEGAIAAAVLTGAWSVEDGVAVLLARRAALASLPRWDAARVACAQDAVPSIPGLHVRAVHAADACVVTGPADAMAALREAVPDALSLEPMPPAHTAVAAPLAVALREAVSALPGGEPRAVWRDPATGKASDPRDPAGWAASAVAPSRLDRLVDGAGSVVVLAARPSLRGELVRAGLRVLPIDGAPDALERTLGALPGVDAAVWDGWRGETPAPAAPTGPAGWGLGAVVAAAIGGALLGWLAS